MQPLLLAEFTFPDGTKLYASTHNLSAAEGGNSYQGNSYLARLQQQDIAAIQSRSEQGIDRISDVTLHLFNADGYLWTNYETAAGMGFKGATVKLSLVLMDIDNTTGAYTFSNDSPAPVKFSGICDAPSLDAGGSMLVVRATTSHSLARIDFPILHVQQRCINVFPGTAAQQAQANDPNSWFFDCGYDNGATAGNPGFTTCSYTKTDCQARGMYSTDSQGRRTARFKAIQWAPATVEGHGIQYTSGKKVVTFSNRNDSIYQRSYPMLYGQQWIKAPIIANVVGDANSTRMEVVICVGDIGGPQSISQVVVNGVIVPKKGAANWDPLFRWNFLDQKADGSIATGGRSGFINSDAGYNSLGDPYGGLATIEIVVYVELAANNSVPDIRILATGPKIPAILTANPADLPTWHQDTTTIPPYIVADLLVWGNYTYAELDLQSFIDEAQYSVGQVSYTDLTGAVKPHNRFICEVALTDRKAGNETVQAILRSFNAQLVPNSETGLLQLRVRKTVADQQPNQVPGSNYNIPIKSVHADGSVGAGYVAYRIDESVLLDDGSGKGIPKIRGPYTVPSAQAANRITAPFQDADNHYADDSISVVDADDVSRAGGYQAGGQQIQQQLSVLGLSNFDQATRVFNTILAENLRGNENRDTRGTRFWELDATSRMEHLRVGQLVLLTYQALVNSGALLAGGLQPLVPLESPAGTKIPGILARVESIKPATNYERATYTLRWHEDYWYTDLYGQTAAPPFSGALLPARLPFPWDPNGEAPIAGDALFDPTELGFQIAQTYESTADAVLAKLPIGGCPVVNQFSSTAQIPFIGLQAFTAPTGGTIPGGIRLHAAISVQGTDGLWTPLSKVSFVDIPVGNGTNTNTFTTPTIAWRDGTVAWRLFAGTSEQTWSGQASGSDLPNTITLTHLNIATFGAPDSLADSLVFQIKTIVHGGVWEDACGNVGAGTIEFPLLDGAANQFAGCVISLQANGQNDEGTVPIASFKIQSHPAGPGIVFSVTPDPVGAGIVPGMPFVLRLKPTGTANGFSDANLQNSYAPGGLTPDAERGNLVRILAGTGRYQVRTITSNTATGITVDKPWDTLLDSTSVPIIESPMWLPAQTAKVSASDFETPSTVASLDVTNFEGQAVLIQALVSDADGNLSLAAYSPLRELYVWGQGTAGDPPDGLTFTPAVYQYGTLTAENVAVSTPAGLAGIDWYLVAVDELKADVYVTMDSGIDAATDPVTFNVTANPNQVTADLAFAAGQWILFNDLGKYEIGLLTKIDRTGGQMIFTVARHYPGAPAGTSTFLAPMANHAGGTQIFIAQQRRFLLNSQTGAFDSASPPTRFDMPIPASCVLAVVAAPYGNGYGSWVVFNCSTATLPGIRTCTGAEFSWQKAGALTAAVGTNIAVAYSVPFDLPYRVGDIYVGTAPTGASLKVNARVSTDNGLTWSTLEQYTIAAAAKISWPSIDPPEGRQAPYSGAWPFQVLRGGNLLNLTIEQVGSTIAGSDLTLKVSC